MLSFLSLSPHLVMSADPEDPGFVGLSMAWGLRALVEDAHVFPTQRLAKRYADFLAQEYLGTFQVVPANGGPLPRSGERACLFCGCVQTFACPDGCSWVHPKTLGGVTEVSVCSACVDELRVALRVERDGQPDDPAQAMGLSLGEGLGLRLGSEAFNTEMKRGADTAQAQRMSRFAEDIVAAIARAIEQEGGR